MGGNNGAGKFDGKSGGKKEKPAWAMPTVPLGIAIACDVIWREKEGKKWSCDTSTVPLGVELTPSQGR
jgi:hypothetical protein